MIYFLPYVEFHAEKEFRQIGLFLKGYHFFHSFYLLVTNQLEEQQSSLLWRLGGRMMDENCPTKHEFEQISATQKFFAGLARDSITVSNNFKFNMPCTVLPAFALVLGY